MAAADDSDDPKGVACSQRAKVVDKGYAVVVLVASFLLNVLVEGAFSGMSVLIVELKHHFDADEQSIVWVGGILMSIGFICSFVVGWLVKRFGCRRVGIIASLLVSASFIAASFSRNIIHLYLTYGVMLGLSITCYFTIASIAVQQYFEKYRAVAQGTLMAGLSVGTFMWPPLTRYLMDVFGWRGTLIFVAGIELHGVALVMLIRPLPPDPQYAAEDDLNEVFLKDGEVPLQAEVEDVAAKRSGGSCFKAMFKTLIIFPHYTVYLIALIMTQSGNVLPYTLVPALADSHGVERYRSALLVSIGAASSGVGRVIAGLLGDHPKVNRILMCGISGIVAGILTTFTALMTNFMQLAIIFAIIGMPSASLMSGYASAAVDIVGKKYVQQGVGLMSVAFGFAHFFCFLFNGILTKYEGGIALGFFIFGVVEAVGGVLFIIVFCFDRHLKHRQEEGAPYSNIYKPRNVAT